MNSNISYQTKYLKYKKKYLDLKNSQDAGMSMFQAALGELSLDQAKKNTLFEQIKKLRENSSDENLLKFLQNNDYISKNQDTDTYKNLPITDNNFYSGYNECFDYQSNTLEYDACKKEISIFKLVDAFNTVLSKGVIQGKNDQEKNDKKDLYSNLGFLWDLLNKYYGETLDYKLNDEQLNNYLKNEADFRNKLFNGEDAGIKESKTNEIVNKDILEKANKDFEPLKKLKDEVDKLKEDLKKYEKLDKSLEIDHKNAKDEVIRTRNRPNKEKAEAAKENYDKIGAEKKEAEKNMNTTYKQLEEKGKEFENAIKETKLDFQFGLQFSVIEDKYRYEYSQKYIENLIKSFQEESKKKYPEIYQKISYKDFNNVIANMVWKKIMEEEFEKGKNIKGTIDNLQKKNEAHSSMFR